MDDRYSCNFAGQCEPDSLGRFASLEECSSACYARPQRDLNYLIQSFAPQVDYLAPSDAQEVLKRMTGMTVNLSQVREVLTAMNNGDYLTLLHLGLTGWLTSSRKRHIQIILLVLLQVTDREGLSAHAIARLSPETAHRYQEVIPFTTDAYSTYDWFEELLHFEELSLEDYPVSSENLTVKVDGTASYQQILQLLHGAIDSVGGDDATYRGRSDGYGLEVQ